MPKMESGLSTVIGIYSLTNTGAVLVHAVDNGGDRILASINGNAPEWCRLEEQYMETTGELEPGFSLGSIFVPLIEVMKV